MGVGNVPSFPSLGVRMSSRDNQAVQPNGQEWFAEVISVVGEVIGFWFKENHGAFGHFCI